MSFFVITGYFQKINFQGFNIVILKFELPSAFFYALCELLEKLAVYVEIIMFGKIRDSLTNFAFSL